MMISSVAPTPSKDVENPDLIDLRLAHIKIARGDDLTPNLNAIKNSNIDELTSASNLLSHFVKEIRDSLFNISHIYKNYMDSMSSNKSESFTSLNEYLDMIARDSVGDLKSRLRVLIANPSNEEHVEDLYQSFVFAKECLLVMEKLDGSSKKTIQHIEKKINDIEMDSLKFVNQVKSAYTKIGKLETQIKQSDIEAQKRFKEEMAKELNFFNEKEIQDLISSLKYSKPSQKVIDKLYSTGNLFNSVINTESLAGMLKSLILIRNYKASRDIWNFKSGSTYFDVMTGYERLLNGHRISKEEYDRSVAKFKKEYVKDQEFFSRRAHSVYLNTVEMMSQFQNLKSNLGLEKDKDLIKMEVSSGTLSVKYDSDIAIIEGDKDFVVLIYPDPFVDVIGAVYAIQMPVDLYNKNGVPEFTKEFRETAFGKATNYMSMDDAILQLSTDEYSQKYFFDKYVEIEFDNKSSFKM